MDIAVARHAAGASILELSPGVTDRSVLRSEVFATVDEAADEVRRREESARASGATVRWVWADTPGFYPELLGRGVRVRRCVDLRLCHSLLRRSTYSAQSDLARAQASIWDGAASPDPTPSLLDAVGGLADLPVDELAAEHARQQDAVSSSSEPGRLRLLTAAESAGALVAAEMGRAGLPFDVQAHDRALTELLGPRPSAGARPAVLAGLAEKLRAELGAPGLNPDSQRDLLQALTRAGLSVRSTRQWELERLDHPAVEVLLEYRRLSRLLTANGWAWMQQWVRDGRFRPEYVPAGAPTGRWATRGGGALQLPKQVRGAVVADPGWTFVVADAAQLEPRVLAAMSGDAQMAAAGRGADLYQALVDQKVAPSRAHAKVAMLGALYGATSGEAGLLMPALQRAYPRATGYVEAAARAGEAGRAVHTWLGRTSPTPDEDWVQRQREAAQVDAPEGPQRAARREAREWGRFTRNFVVQGTAAEWALCWLAAVRRDLEPADGGRRPHAEIVYFLHDEVVVHTPQAQAGAVEHAVRRGAAEAGRLLFGDCGVEFPVSVRVVSRYSDA